MFYHSNVLVLLITYINGLTVEDFSHETLQNSLQRLWGIPDTTAHVGYLFHYQIPNDAFDGKIGRYKVRMLL